jgi:hypothetical protein
VVEELQIGYHLQGQLPVGFWGLLYLLLRILIVRTNQEVYLDIVSKIEELHNKRYRKEKISNRHA